MKKLIALMLVTLLLVTCFVACKKGNQDDTSSTDTDVVTESETETEEDSETSKEDDGDDTVAQETIFGSEGNNNDNNWTNPY